MLSNCEKINLIIFNAIAQYFLGEVHLAISEFEEAEKHFDKAIQLLEHNKIIPSWKQIFKMASVKTKLTYSKKDIDIYSLYGIVNENKVKIWDINSLSEKYTFTVLL